MRRQVGQFSSHIINLLELDIEVGTPIYISDTNIEHMKWSHPNDFIKYGNDIEHIISTPDYVGKNIKDNSIEFTKEYLIDGEFVKVAVRVSSSGIFYARSMYILNPNRVRNFIKKGTLIKTWQFFVLMYNWSYKNINYIKWNLRTERAAVTLVGDVGMSPHLFHLLVRW